MSNKTYPGNESFTIMLNVQGKGTEIIWFNLYPLPSTESPNKNPSKIPSEG